MRKITWFKIQEFLIKKKCLMKSLGLKSKSFLFREKMRKITWFKIQEFLIKKKYLMKSLGLKSKSFLLRNFDSLSFENSTWFEIQAFLFEKVSKYF
jgi:hypothetical protein